MNTDTSKNSSDKKFNFLASFLNFLNAIFEHARKKESSLSNEEFISYGRTDDEKNTIREICEDLDTQCELMKELKVTDLTPVEWYEEKSREILKNCDDDLFKEIRKVDAEVTESQINSEIPVLDTLSEKINPTIENDNQMEGGK